MEFIKQHIEGVWVIQPKRIGDARGYFSIVLDKWLTNIGNNTYLH